MYICVKCGKEFSLKQSKSNHEKTCGNPPRRGPKLIYCDKCNTFITSQGYKKHYKSCNGEGIKQRYTGKGHGWEAGKTYIEIYGKERAKEIRGKISASLIGKSLGIGLTPEIEKNRIEKIRAKIIQRYKDGWETRCGRTSKIDYDSHIAGKVKLDGSWELKVAKYLDSLGVNWIRNKKRFKYKNGEKNCTYCPDFYIDDWDTYLEIKGYETPLDKLKWSQFKEPLLIWKKEDLKKMNLI